MEAERVQSEHFLSMRGILIAPLIFALTPSLATRVFDGSFGDKVQVSSSSDYQKVQDTYFEVR